MSTPMSGVMRRMSYHMTWCVNMCIVKKNTLGSRIQRRQPVLLYEILYLYQSVNSSPVQSSFTSVPGETAEWWVSLKDKAHYTCLHIPSTFSWLTNIQRYISNLPVRLLLFTEINYHYCVINYQSLLMSSWWWGRVFLQHLWHAIMFILI